VSRRFLATTTSMRWRNPVAPVGWRLASCCSRRPTSLPPHREETRSARNRRETASAYRAGRQEVERNRLSSAPDERPIRIRTASRGGRKREHGGAAETGQPAPAAEIHPDGRPQEPYRGRDRALERMIVCGGTACGSRNATSRPGHGGRAVAARLLAGNAPHRDEAGSGLSHKAVQGVASSSARPHAALSCH